MAKGDQGLGIRVSRGSITFSGDLSGTESDILRLLSGGYRTISTTMWGNGTCVSDTTLYAAFELVRIKTRWGT